MNLEYTYLYLLLGSLQLVFFLLPRTRPGRDHDKYGAISFWMAIVAIVVWPFVLIIFMVSIMAMAWAKYSTPEK